MTTITNLNRKPDGVFETLEASTITDGAGVDHTAELADLVDVSPIQSSSDVTVTDTQVGSLNDGDFLQNDSGNLTGATLEQSVEASETDDGSDISQYTINNSSVPATLVNLSGSGILLTGSVIQQAEGGDPRSYIDITVDGGATYRLESGIHRLANDDYMGFLSIPSVKFENSLKIELVNNPDTFDSTNIGAQAVVKQ